VYGKHGAGVQFQYCVIEALLRERLPAEVECSGRDAAVAHGSWQFVSDDIVKEKRGWF
jgi:hypothetical protein